MPIPFPRLDDRSYDDLVRELLARIPGHTPEWTLHQAGDPGRTLIELFAWLADTLLYRVNLIPERQRLAFLRLLNIPMLPARPASGLLALELSDDKALQPVPVPLNTLVKGPVGFETRDELSVLPVRGQVYVRRKPSAKERKALHDVVRGLESVYNIKCGDPYITTPLFADGKADPTGFDLGTDTVDGALWVALLANRAEDLVAARQALGRSSGRSQVLNLGIAPRLAVPNWDAEVGARRKGREVWTWEITSSRRAPDGGPEYLTLNKLMDTTAEFTRNGVVRLELPDSDDLGAPSNDLVAEPSAGVGDRPPRLDDADAAARLVAWARLRPQQAASGLALSWVGINTVSVDQYTTLESVVVGTASGAAGHAVQLPVTSVDPGSLELQVEEPGRGYQDWRRVAELATSGRDARVYDLDPEAGVVTFGDGLRGAAPAAGMRVRVKRVRSGGGVGGNLPAGSLSTVGRPGLKAVQPLATSGGADAETLDQAEKRIPAFLKHRDRAVTAEDYQRLARETPAVALGRVEVLPRFKPQQRRPDVPGVVSVLVLPKDTSRLPPNPRPDRLLLERVHAFLDRRRPVAAELYVIGAEYLPLAVSVAVDLRAEAPRDQILQEVRDALRTYLWPLAPGGGGGEGWPLGQAVTTGELEVAVARVTGVRTVNGVHLFTRPQPEKPWVKVPLHPKTDQQRLDLELWQLPELLAVAAVDGEARAPDTVTGGGGVSGEGEGGVPIPTVPEVC